MDEQTPARDAQYTVLLTDLEDSTRLWERFPDEMEAVVTGTHDLAGSTVERHRGIVVKSTGDGILALFVEAADAVVAAVEIQRQVSGLAFAGIGRVNVRIGLNTGPCRLTGGDVIGRAPNLASRLQDAGHGGQILMSDSTATACAGRLGDGYRVVDLGPYLIRGFDEPVGVHTVLADRLRTAFPPLRVSTSSVEDLPPDETELIGRDGTLAVAAEMIAKHRLVTLWGPGGVGKTRVAVRAATAARRPFVDGVRFVDLSALHDSGAVADALGAGLRVQALAGEQPIESLVRALREARMLVVLDECERVLDGVRQVVDAVLSSCRAIHVLVTTRQPLGTTVERTLEVRPLPIPPLDNESIDVLERLPSVQLFLARLPASSGLTLAERNGPAIAAICRETDGLPLALEVAAARAGIEGLGAHESSLPESVLDRLPAGGASELYSRLAAFSGPFPRELAVRIAPDASRAGRDLDQLVRTAMVQRDDTTPPQYRLLAPFRQRVRAELDDDQRTSIGRLHAALMLERAEEISRLIRTDQEAAAVSAFRAEFVEYRTALELFLEQGLVAEAGRLVVALFLFCLFEPRPEGHRWAAAVAERLSADEPNAADVLGAAALGAWFAGDTSTAIRLGNRAVGASGSDYWARLALVDAFGYAGDVDAAVPHFLALVTAMRADADPFWQVNGLGFDAIGLTMVGRSEDARRRAERALGLARQLGNPDCLHWGFYALGRSLAATDPVGAREAYEQAMRAAREVDSQFNAGLALVEWVGLERRSGDTEMAVAGVLDLLDLLAVSGNRSQLSQTLREAGLLLAESGRVEAAVLALVARRGLPAMPKGPGDDREVASWLDELTRREPDAVARLSVRVHALTEPELIARCRTELAELHRDLTA